MVCAAEHTSGPRGAPYQATRTEGRGGRYTCRTVNVIVLPTYNERDNLRHALGRIREVADGHGVQLHTLIVDDNSPDGTGAIADAIAREVTASRSCIASVSWASARRTSQAFQKGIAEGYDRFFEMDADLSHDVKYLPDFVAACRRGADVVIGSRYVEAAGRAGASAGIIAGAAALLADDPRPRLRDLTAV